MGGYFSLTFRGFTTDPIAWDAPINASEALKVGAPGTSLEEALEDLPSVSDVTVTMVGAGVSPSQTDASGSALVACRGFDGVSNTGPKPLLITFVAVPGAAGALPLLRVDPEALVGNKVVTLLNDGSDGLSVPGLAPVSGTFTLAFRGYTTVALPVGPALSAAALGAALTALPSISSVTVTAGGPSIDYPGSGGLFWVVTFTSPNQAGVLPPLGLDGTNLMGNGGWRERRREGCEVCV